MRRALAGIVLKQSNARLVAIGLVLILGSVGLGSPALAQAGPEVTVVNPASQPVPVTGTVGIAGAPTVNLDPGSLPLPVTGSVDITGTPTVNVGNPATSPVPVRDVDRPSRQPFRMFHGFFVEDGVAAKNESFGTVPAGKRFVIELVSVEVHIPAGQAPFATLIRHPDFLPTYLPLVQAPNSDEYHIATVPLPLYVEGGQEITLLGGRRASPSPGLGTVNAVLYGHLVDTP